MKSAKTTTIAIVEDNEGLREALSALIGAASGFELVGAFSRARDALQALPSLQPRVTLVDIHLPGMSGIELVAALKARHPELLFLMVTMYEDTELIFDSLKAGASGYLLKRTDPNRLIAAIEEVSEGGAPMSPEIARKVVGYFHQSPRTPSRLEQLTSREREILALLAEGYLYKEIADRLDIAVETVKSHLGRTYDKLHVSTRTEATRKFLGR
jgi:DNA-binding NarL/FixJ family response regulator